ncbi:hypothetical protein [Methylobacterium pseudosasicola]|nr:hypothetical protein [Methylobacterium pseudosasicola]
MTAINAVFESGRRWRFDKRFGEILHPEDADQVASNAIEIAIGM